MQLSLLLIQNNGETPQHVPAQNNDVENGEAPQLVRGPQTPNLEETATNEKGEIRADLEAIEHDPGKRIPISRYDVNDQDIVRRRYTELGTSWF